MGEQTHIIRRPDQLSRLDANGRHRLQVEAVAGAASPGAAVSHISAAVLHGFELWSTPLDVVHLSRSRRGGGRKSAPRVTGQIHDARGLVGRVDFLWREQRTVGEFDGRIKYGRLVPAGRSAEDVRWKEKLREDRLRDAGWQVARWTWSDLSTPSLVTGRITAAFSRGPVRY
ncbi:MAG: hypothetical protein U5O16_06340 [Rhodococcus sp. (in: high G+C Gram-positive bacteria)]|uniref:hypothetical protein n=1 Tax=Rhodococcus sp. TaxID=1831 RepID=UPI002AD8470D|nr:hypothetical protein [Rhodococcus sp. (in: high G+C Gram-positive bacteria)]